MFENLRNAFSNAAKSFSEKELKEKEIEEILSQLEISLLESDVATEVIDSIKSDLKSKLVGSTVNKKEVENFVKDSLIQNISNLFQSTPTINILEEISAKKNSNEPYLILFVGINGTGKTTTLAKVAYLLQKSKFSVVIAAADTYRAGAIEQLKEHAKRLNLKVVAQNYGSDPAAVAKDAVLYAKSHKVDCVLIDTAGRMQTSKNLMDQISKISKVIKPDLKIFVGDALAGNDTVNQAREFHEHVKFDGAILTKVDADARGGAALSIVKVTSAPILYVGVGQDYSDLEIFDKDLFLNNVFGTIEKKQAETEQTDAKIETEPTLEIEQQQAEIEQLDDKIETKPELEIEQKQEIVSSPTTKNSSKPSVSKSDPFEGIDTNDIQRYVELFDVPPPESDQHAQELAVKIKKWISQGRPTSKDELEDKANNPSFKESTKKKKSLFEEFRK